MKYRCIATLLGLAVVAPLSAASTAVCQSQAEEILRRLQAEVVNGWSTEQQAKANAIVMDVCEVREEAVEQEIEQAREEEKAKADEWWKENADKTGNRRLKRKSH